VIQYIFLHNLCLSARLVWYRSHRSFLKNHYWRELETTWPVNCYSRLQIWIQRRTLQQTHRIVNKPWSFSWGRSSIWQGMGQWTTIQNQKYIPYRLLKSYITAGRFQVKYKNSYSNCYRVKSGVLEGSLMGPLLYLIYTADMPTTNNTTIVNFAADTALIAANKIQ
jgi:hypothetical protein